MGADCPIPGTPIFLRGIFISTCHRRPLWYFAAKQSETNVVWLVTDFFPSSPRRDGYLSQVTPPPPRRLTSKWYSLATILKISSKSCNFARKTFCHWMNIGSCPGGFLVPPPSYWSSIIWTFLAWAVCFSTTHHEIFPRDLFFFASKNCSFKCYLKILKQEF